MYYGKLLRNIAEAISEFGSGIVDATQRISGISEQIDKHAEAIHAANEREDKQHKIRQEWAENVFAENQKAERDQASRDERSQSIQNSLRWATWLAFLAAATYAWIANEQLKKMDSTLIQTQSQAQAAWRSEWYAQKSEADTWQLFEQDQRAWVSIGEPKTTDEALVVQLHNTGRSPALKVNISQIGFCRDITESVGNYDAERARSRREADEATRKAFSPKILKDVEKEMKSIRARFKPLFPSQAVAPASQREIILPTSGDDPCSGVLKTAINLHAHYVVGKITYRDVFKDTPERVTEYCLVHIAGYAFDLCISGNTMN